MTAWLKRYWGYLVAAIAAVFGIVIAILTFGQVRPKPPVVPKRPGLPDIEIPDPPPLDTSPSDDYQAEKEKPKADGDEVIDDINRRYS